MPMFLRFRTPYVVSLLGLSLAACGTPSLLREGAAIPEEPGIYATVEEGEFMRLDGDREWEVDTWAERSALRGDTQFVVTDPALRALAGPLDEAVRLYRVAWVRSRIAKDGGITPMSGSRWSAPESEPFRVAADVYRVAGRDDAVRVVPEMALGDGLYSIRLSTPGKRTYARLGVNWTTVDHDRYASGNCVDQYLDTTGTQIGFRLCEEQPLLGTGGLHVYLVPPRVETVDNIERLIVQGIVVNTSERDTKIPPLTATIRGADGNVIKEWTFKANTADLKPHDSAAFEIALNDPPPATKTVRVEFAADATAALR
ncbi:FxLYD domain-containing protein [Shumkonia mesophila]|uniref:FxLYD domain-containing protein n=1 Tax=Shumkonia mesophila TaxID=2838854 RepID=UPI002934C1B5|nr:FxLYD domain-containing protein [Shumkonia mesophila]